MARKVSLVATLLLLLQLLMPVISVSAATINNNILPPSNLAYQLVTPSDIKLTWSPVYEATGYNIYGIIDGQLIVLATTKATSHTFTNVEEGSYTYVVSTLSAAGESGPCAPVSVDVVYPQMMAPTSVTYTVRNGNDIVLNWTASQYAENYNLFLVDEEGQASLVSATKNLTYTITNAAEGIFTYMVSAVNSRYGESAHSNPVQVNIVHPTMAAPSNFTYTVTNGNDINLKWGAVSYATNYQVYQMIDSEKVLKSTVTGTAVTYSNMPVGDYLFEVYSNSDRFGQSEVGSQLSLTLGDIELTAPSNLTYKLQNTNDVVLNWTKVTNATSYKIYQIIDGEHILKSTVTGTSVTYTNQPAGEYVYQVYSYSDRFGESLEGSQVSFIIDEITMAAPSNVTYTIRNGNDIVLTWDTTSNANNYKVYQVVNGQKVLKSTVTSTTVSFTNQPAGDYSYIIHSNSTRFGESAEGSELNFSLVHPTIQSPENLVYTIKNATDFTLSWDASAYATSYKVYQIVDGEKVLKGTVSTTSVTYTKMPPGEYSYEVHSVSSRFGESAQGSQVTFKLSGQTMDEPTNLTYSIVNGNDITLKWSAVNYATNYKVYQVVDDEKVLKTTVTSTSVNLTNQPEGDYVFVVHSFSTLLGESPNGTEIAFSLVHPTMAAPANLTYKVVNGNDIVLSWGAVQYANSYKVYELVDGQKVLKATVTTTSATLSKVSFGDHIYVVHSVSTRFGESIERSELSLTLTEQTMVAPGNLTYSIANGNDITLRWDAVTYATNYKVYQIVDGQKVLKTTTTSRSVTYANQPEGDYTFVVHSNSDRFGESEEGSEVSLTLVFPIMQAPVNVTSSIANGNDIVLRWGASSYANNYKVYQIIDGQKILKSTVISTSATYTNMPEGDYTFEIHSYSTRFGESPQAGVASFTLVWPVVQPPVLHGTVYNANNMTFSWKSVQWANEYRVYEVKGESRSLVYKGTALTTTIYNLTEETHHFEMTAYSTRFGESAPSNTITETIVYPVMQPPVASLQLLSPTSVRISWNFVTYANGYDVYEIIDGEPVLLVHNLNNLSYTVTDLSYADHEYYVTSYSNSFGESDPSNIVLAKLVIDTEAPITTANAQTDWTNQNPVHVILTSTDNETGVANTYYSINDSDFVSGTSFTISNEGITKVSFYSVDKVGNIEETKSIYVKIDTHAPVTTTDTSTTWSKDDVTVNLRATDEQSGVVKTYYSINGSDYVEGTTFILREEGIHAISFYSVDLAGNIEEANTVEVKIDKTAPEVSMDLNEEYKLGDTRQLTYSASDYLSGIVSEKMVVFAPNFTTGTELENGASIHLDQPGIYKVHVTVTDAAGLTTTIEKEMLTYIEATIEVTPKVIKGNSGVFTVRVTLPKELNSKGFDLDRATLNGVKALNSNNGYYNQAKLGQFKFERSDFTWTPSEVVVEFRGYVDGHLVVGQTTVKVQK